MKLPRTLAPAIDSIARSTIGKDWNLYASLLEHWREIVGEDYAKSATPVKIIFPRGKKNDEKGAGQRASGSLTVRIPQGLSMEFGFHAERIKSRVNAYFGYEAIGHIALETYYADKKPPRSPAAELSADRKEKLKQQVQHIENKELRDVLESLGESILTSNENK